MLKMPEKEWWENDVYLDETLLGTAADDKYWGPRGPAIVKAYPSGSTQMGWGLKSLDGSAGFMERYLRREFSMNRALYGYKRDKHAAALVMRSARLVCIDIDGKNGGLAHVKDLGLLPRTLAEISKSGNGYHLFYEVPDTWDPKAGFAMINDQLGIVTGVDIKAVGVVYHYNTQRWNSSEIVMAPDWLLERLTRTKRESDARATQVQGVLDTQDETEILIMQHELLDQLAKTIPAGRRNTTLFAIGVQLKTAQIKDWQAKIEARGVDLGLPDAEITRIIRNIERQP